MVPAEFVTSAVSVPTDALTQAHHFRDEVLSCQRREIVIYHVFSFAQFKTSKSEFGQIMANAGLKARCSCAAQQGAYRLRPTAKAAPTRFGHGCCNSVGLVETLVRGSPGWR